MVKELRERTGAGMMECKKALVETDGDLEAAVEQLRKSGQAKADKKAGRVAADGKIVIAAGDDAVAVVEVNSETDFVAKDENFSAFADKVGALVLARRPASLEELMAAELDGQTVEEARKALIAKVGENIGVRRFELVPAEGNTGVYSHGARIGSVVVLDGGDAELARDLAMHVAASNPACISADDVDPEQLASERRILTEQAQDSGKPAEIIEKMVEGRLRKWLSEITLVGQPFVKDPDVTVGKLLDKAGASVKRFVRYEVGEGIEKKEENFAEEVMAQIQGS
jgi:elongation factor Ts